jgi:hypothetical protein
MISRETRRAIRKEYLTSGLLLAAGLAIMGLSLTELSLQQQESLRRDMVQVAQPAQDSPTIAPGKDNGPAESKPGGTRPTTPAPEPARPDAEAQKAGAQPALPPAPAEKIGAPVQK